MNYKNIPNVDYARFDNDSDNDYEADVEAIARVDEMYLDGGRLHIGLEGPKAYHSIDIPVLRGKGWADFVRSLVGTLR